MKETRIPKLKGAIDKRNRIIEQGFNLMCEKGFHNVSTPDIAKECGVSTGIIYQYFNDKREIFLEGVKSYSNSIIFPMLSILQNLKGYNDLDKLLDEIIDKFIETHTISKKSHEELIAMSHLDDEIANILNESELQMTEKIVTLFTDKGIILNNPLEKIHIIYGILDNYCHEVVYHKHDKINYDIMKKEVKRIILNVIKEK